MGAARSRLRRLHVWLGWVVGLPILLWVVSGLVMVVRPIEEVRGTALLKDPVPITLESPPVPPAIQGRPLSTLKLEQRAAGPRWVAVLADGTTFQADPASGRRLPRLSASDARQEVASRYSGTAQVLTVAATDPAAPPIELRRSIAAWRVAMDDGTHFYVDAATGEIVARRTRWWRFYDFMWGLHIMDPGGREDTHNPWVIGFAVASLLMAVLALVLLPMTTRRGKGR